MTTILAGIEVLLLAASALLLVPLAVLTLQVVAAVWPGRRSEQSTALSSSSRPSIAVLMPAHDEAIGIAPVIAAVKARLGPHDRLLVVADNCSDDTAGIAARAGAEVVERFDASRRGKGYCARFRRAPPGGPASRHRRGRRCRLPRRRRRARAAWRASARRPACPRRRST
jgi:hypothetical protein